MKKVFLVAGELSGDKVGAWYLKRLNQENFELDVSAVGGDFLKQAGAKIYERIENLNVAGIVEIIKHLPFILKFLKQLSDYILKNNFDHVILIDFPGFNLRLAKTLKTLNPEIKITYLSPPQLWIWGKWRIKKLKKYCDDLIVLYPFEVEWYKKNGLKAEFLGNPVCSDLNAYFNNDLQALNNLRSKENCIAIIPGSRKSEIEKLLPILADVARRFKLIWPRLKIIMPLAESLSSSLIENKLRKEGLFKWGRDIIVVQGKEEKLKALNKCCLAITKPGTVCLELALLQIPAVVFYKTSGITYFLARLFVKVKYMALPNLLENQIVYKEFIQDKCKSKLIFDYTNNLYKNFLNQNDEYKKLQHKLLQIKNKLCNFADL